MHEYTDTHTHICRLAPSNYVPKRDVKERESRGAVPRPPTLLDTHATEKKHRITSRAGLADLVG